MLAAIACGPAPGHPGRSPGIEKYSSARDLYRLAETYEHSVYHGGYSGRSRANMWFVPETQWGTVIVTNHGRGDDAITSDIFYALSMRC